MPSDDLDSPDAFEGLPKSRGELKSANALALALAKDRKTIDKMIRDGMPVFQRGGVKEGGARTAHQIDLAAAWDWAVRHAREMERETIGGRLHSDGEEAYD